MRFTSMYTTPLETGRGTYDDKIQLLPKRIKTLIEKLYLVPEYHFSSRKQHFTIEQVHRLGLAIRKLHNILRKKYLEIFRSYISDRIFRNKQGNEK